jgi:hypothetical protein
MGCAQGRCATRLRYTPTGLHHNYSLVSSSLRSGSYRIALRRRAKYKPASPSANTGMSAGSGTAVSETVP